MNEKDARVRASAMPMAVGGTLSLIALSASIFAGQDPVTSLTRGGVALAGGFFLTSLWYAFTGRQLLNEDPQEGEEEESKSDETPTVAVEESATESSEPNQSAA